MRAEADGEVIMVERSGFLEKNASGRNLLIQERPYVFYGGPPTSDVIFDSNQSEREKFRQRTSVLMTWLRLGLFLFGASLFAFFSFGSR